MSLICYFAIAARCPWNFTISIDSPGCSPRVFDNDSGRCITNSNDSMINSSTRWAWKNSWTVTPPSCWSYCYCYWLILKQTNQLSISNTVVWASFCFCGDSICWTDTASIIRTSVIWILRFSWRFGANLIKTLLYISPGTWAPTCTLNHILFWKINA